MVGRYLDVNCLYELLSNALLLALRTAPPVNDFGLVDFETVIVVRGKARSYPNRAVDVVHLAATATYQVMMVVIHAILVSRRRPGRLNPAHEVFIGQHTECIVYGLARNRSDNRADVFDQIISRCVRM